MRKLLISTLTPICCLAVLLLLVFNFSVIHVIGISMWPTIRDNQFAVLERYWFREPERGDVIVFRAPPNTSQNYVKRIIGIAGDVIRIDESTVTLDGVTLSEPYVSPSLQGNPNPNEHLFVIVPPESYFVMGDDRLYSNDSRSWGFVPRKNILGRLVYLYGSPDNTRFLPDASVVFAQIHPTGVFQTSYTSRKAAPSGSVLLIGFPAAGIGNGLLRRILRKKTQTKKASSLQPTAYRNQRRSTLSQALHLVPLVLVLLMLCSCSIIPPKEHQTNTPPEPWKTPILSSSQASRVLQFCVDTKPLFPDTLFKASASLVADMLDSSIHTNEGTVQVYISYITSRSYLNDAFSFSVPAIPADPQEPALLPTPNPASYNNPYDHASAAATVTSANATVIATWQAQLRNNHEKLAAVRALVKQYTKRLRSLPNIWDSTGEDIAGCLQSASQRFQGFNGKKKLIIASPMLNMVNASNSINLSGSTVEVIFRTCELASASACIAAASAWKQSFLSFGVSHVSILDPQQSQVERPMF